MLSGIAGLLLTVILWNSRVKTIALSIYSRCIIRYFPSRFNAKIFTIFIQKISEANTFVYYTHIFFIGGIKKVVGLLFQTLSFKGLLCCFIAFYMSTALCLFIIIEIRKFVRKGCNRINNPRVCQFIELLVP